MRIENDSVVDQITQNDKPFQKGKVTTGAKSFSKVARNKADALDRSVRMGQTGYDKEEVVKKSTVEEFQEKMGSQMDAKERKNQMAVLSNTMTPEEYQKMQEEGFSAQDMDSRTIVTVTDKIKAQLAKAGIDVSCMGNTLSKEQLEELGGSIAAANQLEKYFEGANLPATEANMTEGMEALKEAEQLLPRSEELV